EDGREEEGAHARLRVHARRRRRRVRSRRHAPREPRQADHAAAPPLLQLLRVRLILQRDRPLTKIGVENRGQTPFSRRNWGQTPFSELGSDPLQNWGQNWGQTPFFADELSPGEIVVSSVRRVGSDLTRWHPPALLVNGTTPKEGAVQRMAVLGSVRGRMPSPQPTWMCSWRSPRRPYVVPRPTTDANRSRAMQADT